MRVLLFSLTSVGLCLGHVLGARAGDCIINGPLPQLDSQTVEWAFEIASGQSCTRGLRSGAMLLDSVHLSSPAKAGVATVQGYSFSYRAPPNFKGEDRFAVTMSGTYRRVHGNSVIQVHVLVR
jgi:hypothetical protein